MKPSSPREETRFLIGLWEGQTRGYIEELRLIGPWGAKLTLVKTSFKKLC
jgi:hypothetical protein